MRYFILRRGGEPIGSVGVEKIKEDLCYLERLAMLPGKRRQGLGRRLALCAIEKGEEVGAGRVGIGIIAAQIELKQWYARLGFVTIETKRFSHLPFEVCLMECCLDSARVLEK